MLVLICVVLYLLVAAVRLIIALRSEAPADLSRDRLWRTRAH